MKKLESLALLVAVVGVGMAILYSKKSSSGIVKTQYAPAWTDGAESVKPSSGLIYV